MNTRTLSFIALCLAGAFLITRIIMRSGILSAKTESLYVINVLDKALYDDCHIKGSIQVPFDKVTAFAARLPKETELVIYCSNYMCSASGDVARQLGQLGFKHVWAYEAGMAEWFVRGLPIEGKAQSGYLKKENKSLAEHDSTVSVITTELLKEKMEKAGLLR